MDAILIANVPVHSQELNGVMPEMSVMRFMRFIVATVIIILLLLIPVATMWIWLWLEWSPLLFALGIGANSVCQFVGRKKS